MHVQLAHQQVSSHRNSWSESKTHEDHRHQTCPETKWGMNNLREMRRRPISAQEDSHPLKRWCQASDGRESFRTNVHLLQQKGTAAGTINKRSHPGMYTHCKVCSTLRKDHWCYVHPHCDKFWSTDFAHSKDSEFASTKKIMADLRYVIKRYPRKWHQELQ